MVDKIKLKMLKILIVEDELIVARDIRKTLKRNGYVVTAVCRTVEEAILLAKEQRPALVLVDIFLKGNLTGIDLAVKLNEEGIPFIYVSANSNQPVLEAAKYQSLWLYCKAIPGKRLVSNN